MPLFGKHSDTNKLQKKHGSTTHHDRAEQDAALRQQHMDPALGTGVRTHDHAPGMNTGLGTGTGAGMGMQGAGAGYDPAYNTTTTATGHMGAGAPAVPPASHINNDPGAPVGNRSGGGRLAGKMESAVGTLVGSQALKEKGFQKEHEAGAFKMQSAEIAEAERLEKEALLRRERAVAHGAHPDNRHLGGLANANTLSDLGGGNGMQRGAGGAGY